MVLMAGMGRSSRPAFIPPLHFQRCAERPRGELHLMVDVSLFLVGCWLVVLPPTKGFQIRRVVNLTTFFFNFLCTIWSKLFISTLKIRLWRAQCPLTTGEVCGTDSDPNWIFHPLGYLLPHLLPFSLNAVTSEKLDHLQNQKGFCLCVEVLASLVRVRLMLTFDIV